MVLADRHAHVAYHREPVAINFTQVAMQAMRAGSLTREANRSRNLYDAFHAMHAACLLHLRLEWKRRGLSIQDFGFLKKEIETLALKKPNRLLAVLRAHDAGPALAMGVSGKAKDFASFE